MRRRPPQRLSSKCGTLASGKRRRLAPLEASSALRPCEPASGVSLPILTGKQRPSAVQTGKRRLLTDPSWRAAPIVCADRQAASPCLSWLTSGHPLFRDSEHCRRPLTRLAHITAAPRLFARRERAVPPNFETDRAQSGVHPGLTLARLCDFSTYSPTQVTSPSVLQLPQRSALQPQLHTQGIPRIHQHQPGCRSLHTNPGCG